MFENGTNKGTGFGPWIFATTNNGVYDATMNTPLDMGNISTSGKTFSIRAWDFNNNKASAYRTMNQDLPVGCTFSFRLAAAYRNGKKGFNLYRDSEWGNFLFNFEISNDQYYFNGIALGWSYASESIFDINVFKPNSNNVTITVSRSIGNNSASVTLQGAVRGFQFYVENTTDSNLLNSLLFNNLQYYL